MKKTLEDKQDFQTFQSVQNFKKRFLSNRNSSALLMFKVENDIGKLTISINTKLISIGKIFTFFLCKKKNTKKKNFFLSCCKEFNNKRLESF